MTVACIIQARMGSKRFPGKVMQTVWDKPMIEEVVESCSAIEGVDVVAVAIPSTRDNEMLFEFLKGLRVSIWRGDELDLLARYAGAAAWLDATTIMRITGDCPLIDAAVCGEVLKLFKSEQVDYASNVMPRTFPKGLDCEVFSAAALLEAHVSAPDPIREHVTTWMKWARHIERANYISPSGGVDLSRTNLSVDTEEDMQRLREMWAKRPAAYDEIERRVRNGA